METMIGPATLRTPWIDVQSTKGRRQSMRGVEVTKAFKQGVALRVAPGMERVVEVAVFELAGDRSEELRCQVGG